VVEKERRRAAIGLYLLLELEVEDGASGSGLEQHRRQAALVPVGCQVRI
jgi:hypothetical protein